MIASNLSASFSNWYHSPPVWLSVRSSKWTIGLTAFGAAFTDGFLYGSIVPVLPFSLTERSGVPEEDVQFWLSLLLTVFGVFLGLGAPVAGWFADRGSRSTPFLFGLILAIVSTLVFCLARAPGLLLVARILQGLAASVIYTAGLALVADAVGADEIGAWMGFVFSGNTLGLLFAPFIAGIVYDRAGYYAVFGIVFGVFGIDLILRAFMIEKRQAVKWLPDHHHDPETNGTTRNKASVESGPYRSSDGGTEPSNKNDAQSRDPLQATEETALLNQDHQSPSQSSWFRRNFPKAAILWTSPRLIAAVYGCLTHTMLLASIDSILPLFVKRTFSWTATAAGSIFLTITCPSLFGTFFGALADRYGSRFVSLTGLTLTSVNLGLMGLVKNNVLLDQILLCVFLVLAGIGLNLILAPLAADVFASVDALAARHPTVFGKKGAYAQAYSIMTGALGLGTALGPIIAGAMYDNTNWPITMGVLAGMCALPIYGVFFYTGGNGDSKDEECRE